MIAWIFLFVLITTDVSRAAGRCLKSDFVGKLSCVPGGASEICAALQIKLLYVFPSLICC